ncbi:MAG: hypothetical protein ACJ73S_18100 [Mycobacteriales bacterium]
MHEASGTGADVPGVHEALHELAGLLRAEHDRPTGPLAGVEADSQRHGEDLVSLWQDVVNAYAQATDRWLRAALAMAHAVAALGVAAAELEPADGAEADRWLRRVRGA